MKRPPKTTEKPSDSVEAQVPGPLSLLTEPGGIVIEAFADADQVAAGGKPRLPRFSMVAYTGGTMKIAGWRFPVVVDLAGLSIPTQSRPIRFGHDMASGVGHTDQIRIDGGKLLATGVVSRDTPAAKEIVVSARNGFPWQASIGASVDEFHFVKDGQEATVNGRQFSGPVNVVRKATLGEISFVDSGADGQTSALVAAAASERKPSQEKKTMDDNATTSSETAGIEATQVQTSPAAAATGPRRSRPVTPSPRRPTSVPGPWPRASGLPQSGSFATAGFPRSRARRSRRAGTRPAANWKSSAPAGRRPRRCTCATTR